MENNSDGGDARGRGRGPWRWQGGRGEKEAVGAGAGERLAREGVLPRRPRGGAVRAVISCSSYARLASGGGKLEGRHLLLSGLVSSFALVLLVSSELGDKGWKSGSGGRARKMDITDAGVDGVERDDGVVGWGRKWRGREAEAAAQRVDFSF
uniref:DUF834 domain-containing protein n=1 Tax=Oryza nivara TaxID=4536 RepID=A0A0E0G8N8_ORYNI